MRHSLRSSLLAHLALRTKFSAVAAATLAMAITWIAPWSAPAHAGQPRDWMIAVQPEGTDLNLDVVLPGTQVTLEHRIAIYNNTANQLILRGNGLLTAGFFEGQGDVDLRILVLTLGASLGYQNTFRNQTFAPGESTRAMHRLERDLSGDFDSASWSFFEGRAILSLPFNDGLVFNSINRFRTENRPDRSLDWRQGVVHDSGFYFSSENWLLIKDRHFGGMGPALQVLNYNYDGDNRTQLNFGAVFTTRVGLIDRNDLIFVQALFNAGQYSKSYGLHYFTIPMSLVLAYRVAIPVWRPE